MRRFVLLAAAATTAGCNLYIGDDAEPDPRRGCGGGPVDPPSLAPGTVRYASRLATEANEFAWDVARAPNGALFVAGDITDEPLRGLLACFEPDGALGWSETDTSVHRWRGLIVDSDGAPVVIGDLASGGGVVRRVPLDGDPGPAWETAFVSPAGAATMVAITPWPGGGAIVAGTFYGTVQAGAFTLVSAGASDGVVLVLDRDGNVVRSFTFGGEGEDYVEGVTAAPDGSIVVAASTFSGTLELGPVPLPPAGGQDALVFAVDPGGQVPWAHRFGGPAEDIGLDVAVDEVGRIFFSTAISDADLGNGPVTGAAVVAFDSAGTQVWATVLVSYIVRLWALAAGGGKVYAAGVYFQPASFGGTPLPGDGQAAKFVAELSDTGTLGWLAYGDGPTGGAALEVGPSLVVAGPYLVNFDMGGVHLDPSTPHDIYVMEIAR